MGEILFKKKECEQSIRISQHTNNGGVLDQYFDATIVH